MEEEEGSVTGAGGLQGVQLGDCKFACRTNMPKSTPQVLSIAAPSFARWLPLDSDVAPQGIQLGG